VSASSFGTYRTDAARQWDVSGATFENKNVGAAVNAFSESRTALPNLGNARSYGGSRFVAAQVGRASGAAPSASKDRGQFTSRQDL
jgi:hypothetical protein